MAFVQVGQNQDFSSDNPLTVTFATVGVGSTIVGVAIMDDAGPSSILGLQDTQGNPYDILDTLVINGVKRAICFIAGNAAGGGGANTVVSLLLSQTIGNWEMVIHEYSGRSAVAVPVDNGGLAHAALAQTAPGTAPDGLTSGPVTTITNGCDIFGATAHVSSFANNATAGTGFTPRSTTAGPILTEDDQNQPAGSIAATFTATVSDSNFTFVVAIAPASAPPPPTGFVGIAGMASSEW